MMETEGDNEDKIPTDADMEIGDYLSRLADALAYCRDVEKEQGAAEQSYQFLIGCCFQRVWLMICNSPFSPLPPYTQWLPR